MPTKCHSGSQARILKLLIEITKCKPQRPREAKVYAARQRNAFGLIAGARAARFEAVRVQQLPCSHPRMLANDYHHVLRIKGELPTPAAVYSPLGRPKSRRDVHYSPLTHILVATSFCGPLAQWSERRSSEPRVMGSTPIGIILLLSVFFFFFFFFGFFSLFFFFGSWV